MSMALLDKVSHPLIAAMLALAGAGIGGTIYVSASGAVLGFLTALGACGIIGVVLAVLGWATGASAEAPLYQPGTDAAAVQAAAPSVEQTASEAELLSAGRFADYHLAKAKRFLAAGNVRDAGYHAAASLAHGDLPEARAVRNAARARTT